MDRDEREVVVGRMIQRREKRGNDWAGVKRKNNDGGKGHREEGSTEYYNKRRERHEISYTHKPLMNKKTVHYSLKWGMKSYTETMAS